MSNNKSRNARTFLSLAASTLFFLSTLDASNAMAFDAIDASRALTPNWNPQGPANGSTVTTVEEAFDGWSVEATFAWYSKQGRPAWHLIESRVEISGEADASKTGAKHEPGTPPDPNPPTLPPPDGNGSQTSTFWSGGWTYTVDYVWGVRNGVLGWHISSYSVKYTPQKPKPILQ